MQEWQIFTPEYPTRLGGVSDYTKLLAAALSAAGDRVHVWYPETESTVLPVPGVCLHPQAGRLTPLDLWPMGRELDRIPRPRLLLVQWVPHGYGCRSMNLPFCLWLWGRARLHGDQVEIMVHEPFLAFGEGNWRQNLVAVVHRLMTIILLRAAKKVRVAIPAWERCWKPYLLRKKVTFEWSPVPSNVPVVEDPAAVSAIRQRYASNSDILFGSFGTFGLPTTRLLEPILQVMCGPLSGNSIILIGKDSEAFRRRVVEGNPSYASRVHATGTLPPEDLSRHISACDILIQPYPDGVSSRRSSVMAGLCHGKPIVTTVGTLTEPLWAESGAVVLGPVGDTDALVAQMRYLANHRDTRELLATRAKALYDERFSLQRLVVALRRSSA